MTRNANGTLSYGYMPMVRFAQHSHATMLSRIIQSSLTVCYVFLLVIAYRFQVMEEYGYVGYGWNPNALTIITGTLISVLLAALMPVRLTRGGDIIIYALFAIALVPSLIFPAIRSNIGIHEIIKSQIVLGSCFLFLITMSRLPVVNLAVSLFTQRSFLLCVCIVNAAMLGAVAYYFGLPSQIPGLFNVYDVRLESRGTFASVPSFVGYFWFWIARVIAPTLFIMGLIRRSMALVLYGLLTLLYLYSLTGLKSVAFSLVLFLFMWMLARILGRNLGSFVIAGLVGVVLIGTVMYSLFDWFPITDLVTRRTLIVPGTLMDQYLRFYADNEYARWSHSFLSIFYENPYASGPSGVVGSFFGRDTTTATAHIWADGYANFGYLGMAFVTLITGLIVWLLNSVTVGKSAYLVVPLAAMIGYLLANTSLTTAMLTHGVVLAILLLQFAPAETEAAYANKLQRVVT